MGKIIDSKQNLEIEECLKRLSSLAQPYYEGTLSLVELEALKRALLGELQYLTHRMGFVKSFKSNNSYFDEYRKRLKAMVIESLVAPGPEKVSATVAETKVYNHPKYKTTLKGIQEIKRRYIEYEDLHKHYQKVLDCVHQSVSVESKSLSQNI